jgi:hypothetical protein
MKEYHKIHALYKRYTPEVINQLKSEGVDTSDIKKGSFIFGEYARPEFELLKDVNWQFTEKVDGTNIRITLDTFYPGMKVKHCLKIGGRTDKAVIPKPLIESIEELIPPKKFYNCFIDSLDKKSSCQYPWPIVLYGEGYGKKIQKGGGDYISDGVSFILFDVRIGHVWLTRESVEDVADKLGIKVVPVIAEGSLQKGIDLATNGFPSQLKDTPPEGLIAKTKPELLDRRGQRIITKLKLCDFKPRNS